MSRLRGVTTAAATVSPPMCLRRVTLIAQFYGIDFMNAHFCTAETPSRRSGLENTTFLGKSFTGWEGAMKLVSKIIGSDDGDVVLAGRPLSLKEVKGHLSDRVRHIHSKQLSKLLELGVVLLDSYACSDNISPAR